MRIKLKHGSWVELFDDWLPSALATALSSQLEAELDWQQRSITLFGKQVVQPRLVAWCGDLPYRYSGATLPPRNWTASCRRLRQMLEVQTGVEFNHALGNLYRNGLDSMGFHSDNEPELGLNPTLASLSFGAPRRFVLKAKLGRDQPKLELELRHGGLLLMGGSLQRHYLHGVPKQRAVSDARINLTFRRLYFPPADPRGNPK